MGRVVKLCNADSRGSCSPLLAGATTPAGVHELPTATLPSHHRRTRTHPTLSLPPARPFSLLTALPSSLPPSLLPFLPSCFQRPSRCNAPSREKPLAPLLFAPTPFGALQRCASCTRGPPGRPPIFLFLWTEVNISSDCGFDFAMNFIATMSTVNEVSK